MPNRLLREGITTSEKIDRLSTEAELFYYRLLVAVDDYGRIDARPAVLIAKCFPLRTDRIKAEHIFSWLAELDSTGILMAYEHPKGAFLQLLNFDKPRAKESKCPSPNEKTSVRKHMFARENTCEHVKTNVPYSDSDSDSNSDVHPATASPPLVLTPQHPVEPKPEPKKNPDHGAFIARFHELYQAHHDGAAPTWGKKQGGMVQNLLKAQGLTECLRRMEIFFSPACNDFVARGGRDLGSFVAFFDKLATATKHGKPEVVDEQFRADARRLGLPIDGADPPNTGQPETGSLLLPPVKASRYARST